MMNEWIVSSSILIAAVLLGRFLLRGKISLRLQYALWAVVLLRLLLPIQIFTSDYGAGSIARDVDISAPVRQIYASANEDRYEREYDAAYRQVVADYEALAHRFDQSYDPIVAEKTARELTQQRLELDLKQILYHVWFAGMVVMTAVIVSCNIHLSLQLKRRRWALEVPESLLPVYITEAVPTPCIFGLFWPAIYLTPAAAKDPQTRAHVLEHELTHYRHWDHVWSVLRSLCLVLHWYNPLVWIAAKVSRADAELACDEGALARLGENQRGDYGRTLIGLTCSAPISDLLLTATTMTGSAGSIRERIKLLMARPRNTLLTLTAVILMITLVVGCTFSGAPETTQTPETTQPTGDGHLNQTDPADLTPIEQAMKDYADKNPRRLTAEEVIQARDGLASTVYNGERDEYTASEVAAFFTSFYDDVRGLDFAEFLRYFPASGEASEEEFQLLRQKYGADFDWAEHESLQDMPVPVHRYGVSDIDAVIRRYANIPFQELKDKESVYYLEETDSYYNFTSDFGPGIFVCVDGFVYDGGAILYSENAALFLTESAGHYSITAHLPVADSDVDNDMSYTGKDLPIADDPARAAYFDDLLNPDLYRSEADWYPRALTSCYDSPAGIDLFQLFYGGIPGADHTPSAEELAFLKDQPGYEPDFDLDRIPAAEMDRVLQTYFGITLDQTEGIGLEKFLYWEENDCYYHCHTDTNLDFRDIIDCQDLGDGVWHIRYTNAREEFGGVTLQYADGIWTVLSNVSISYTPTVPTVHGDLFNAEGVLTYPGIDLFMTEEQVLAALGVTPEQCMEYQKTSGDGMTANGFTVRRSDAFGVPMEVNFTFRSFWPDEAPVLTEVYGSFENQADFEAVRNLYAQTLGKTDYQDSAGVEEGWRSGISLGELVGKAGYEILDRCAAAGETAMNRPASYVEWIRDSSICWFTELPVSQTDEVLALFAADGDPWCRAALVPVYADAYTDFDPAAFFSTQETGQQLREEEKALIQEVCGKNALKKPILAVDAWQMDEILQTYVGADSSFMDMSAFLYCPETNGYLLVREEIPELPVPQILSCELLAENQVCMIYRFPGEEQTYCATLLKGKNWKVCSNHLLLQKPLNARALTEEQVAMVRAGFAPSIYDAATGANDGNPLACFTHSMYTDISEMNKFDFLCYFPATAEGTKEELALLIEKYPEYFEDWTAETMPLPVHRYDADALDDLMMEYAGISFRDLPDGRWAHYLEETDSYYNYTSDFGLLGFPCTGGWVYDGGAMLCTDFQPSSVLVLTERDGKYRIQAHLPALIAE